MKKLGYGEIKGLAKGHMAKKWLKCKAGHLVPELLPARLQRFQMNEGRKGGREEGREGRKLAGLNIRMHKFSLLSFLCE